MKKFAQNYGPVCLTALTTVLGMQFLRTFPPYLQYILGDRLGWSAIQMGVLALVLFAGAFLTGRLARWLSLRRLLWLAVGGLGLLRLLVQFWTGDPLVDLLATLPALLLFLLSLPALALAGGPAVFAPGLLLGLVLDTALHGLFLTYDFIWQSGLWPNLLALGLAGLAVACLPAAPLAAAGRAQHFPLAPAWLALGPFLFLQLLVFQNQARLAVLTGWSLPPVFAWVLAAHLLGLTLAVWKPVGRAGTAVAGLVLVAAVWPWADLPPAGALLALLAGQVAGALLLATGLSAGGAASRARVGLIHGLSMLLLVGLLFAYYVPYDLPVPYRNGWLLVLAAVVVGAGAVWRPGQPQWSRVPLVPAWGLLVLPLVVWLAWGGSTAGETAPASVRVMDYNLHNGFSTAGQLNIDALAQVIQAQQPDIVLLQEVSRGWVVNGSLDSLNWLARRLGMPYHHFTPAADVLWGTAVLSRYPIRHAEDHPLPPRNLPLNRSFAYLEIEVGRSEPLRVINTHFHHLESDSSIRRRQTETVLSFLGDRPLRRFILTGDLNATPTALEIEQLYRRGFTDVVTAAGVSPEETFPSFAPVRRLDYILVSPDLRASAVVIPRSTASDHLGIAATLLLAGD